MPICVFHLVQGWAHKFGEEDITPDVAVQSPIDHYSGRLLCVDLSRDCVDPAGFDSEYGKGALECIIATLRDRPANFERLDITANVEIWKKMTMLGMMSFIVMAENEKKLTESIHDQIVWMAKTSIAAKFQLRDSTIKHQSVLAKYGPTHAGTRLSKSNLTNIAAAIDYMASEMADVSTWLQKERAEPDPVGDAMNAEHAKRAAERSPKSE